MLIEIKTTFHHSCSPKRNHLAPLSQTPKLLLDRGRRKTTCETRNIDSKPIEKEQMLNQYDAGQFVIMSTTERILRNDYARK